jgi:hypothetical protein
MKTYNDLLLEMKTYPDGNAQAQVKKISHLVDLEKVANEDPVFFEDICWLLGRGSDLDSNLFLTIDFYNQLKYLNPNAGNKFRETVIAKKEVIRNRILNFDLSKPRVENIQQYLYEYEEYRETVVAYNFIDVKDAIEKAYDINFRGLYGDIKRETLKEILKNECGFTDEAIELAYQTKPNRGGLCAQVMSALGNFVLDRDIPYVDHWHHLTDMDFRGMRKGYVHNMEVYCEHPQVELNPIFTKYRQIYTLECGAGLKLKNGKIPFYIDW